MLPVWRIHRAVGMGGDQLVPALVGREVDEETGDAIRETRDVLYRELIDEVEPLEGARDLIVELKGRSNDDVEATKPAPDLVLAALEKAGTSSAVMIGDTLWDVEAARKAGVETICAITGGYSEAELRDAGAAAVFESVVDLREHLDETPPGSQA